MSNVRVFWIIWCVMWALGWLLIGLFTIFIGWLFVPLSLLAILIPIGSTQIPAPLLPLSGAWGGLRLTIATELLRSVIPLRAR